MVDTPKKIYASGLAGGLIAEALLNKLLEGYSQPRRGAGGFGSRA
jgi:hypothetical protein